MRISTLGMIAIIPVYFLMGPLNAAVIAGISMWFHLVEAIQDIEVKVLLANFDPAQMIDEVPEDERD